jgi:hypothetical protein
MPEIYETSKGNSSFGVTYLAFQNILYLRLQSSRKHDEGNECQTNPILQGTYEYVHISNYLIYFLTTLN